MKKSFIPITFSLMALTGCAYQAPVSVSAAYDVYSSYEERVPGRWAIFVDGSDFKDSDVKPSSYQCSAHTYPIDSADAFEKSTVKTFANLVESIERVNSPIPAAQLEQAGFDGQIIIKGQDMDVDLIFIPGFWTMRAEAEVDYEASLSAFMSSGKVLGTTVSAEGEEKGDGGTACDGGADAIGKAAEDGIKRVLRQLGERFSSSSRIREAMAQNDLMDITPD